MRLPKGHTNAFSFAVLVAVYLFGVAQAQEPPQATTERAIRQFAQSVKPIFAEHCFGCHGPNEQEADLRLDEFDPNLVEGKDGGKWREVLDALNRGDMPPDDAPQPTMQQRNQAIDWISSELDRAARLRRSTGGHVTLRRLTRQEYHNTMRDLLGVEIDFARDLPPDSKGIDGYKNNGQYQVMSELQLQEYYLAAKRGLAAAIVQGDSPQRIHQVVTEGAKNVRVDKYALASFNKELGGTVVGPGVINPKSKKRGGETTMFLLCLDELPPTGTFRVKITAAAWKSIRPAFVLPLLVKVI